MLEIIIIAVVTSVSCSLIGTFLVLKNMSMLVDSISHTILLGIVIAYFITQDLNSPFLIVGATLMGVFTTWITQTLSQKNLISDDSSIGLVFPFLFSIAIILISKFAKNTHIDIDSVLLGELAFAPFNRLVIFGVDIGAYSIYTCLAVLVLNLLCIKAFYKEFYVSIFDPSYAVTIGVSNCTFHYLIMTLVSLTCVVSFEAVGSVLVVAFMIGPPIIALLCTNNIVAVLFISSCIATICAIIGCGVAVWCDVSIAGAIAVTVGLVFFLVLVHYCSKLI